MAVGDINNRERICWAVDRTSKWKGCGPRYRFEFDSTAGASTGAALAASEKKSGFIGVQGAELGCDLIVGAAEVVYLIAPVNGCTDFKGSLLPGPSRVSRVRANETGSFKKGLTSEVREQSTEEKNCQ